MIGPVSFSVPLSSQELSPLFNPAPAAAETIDNPSQPVKDRQPLTLPTERVDLSSKAQETAARPSEGTNEQARAPEPKPIELPDVPNSGVTYRVLDELNNRIQSRVVDRQSREVLRSVPPDQLIEFYTRFQEAGENMDVEG